MGLHPIWDNNRLPILHFCLGNLGYRAPDVNHQLGSNFCDYKLHCLGITLILAFILTGQGFKPQTWLPIKRVKDLRKCPVLTRSYSPDVISYLGNSKTYLLSYNQPALEPTNMRPWVVASMNFGLEVPIVQSSRVRFSLLRSFTTLVLSVVRDTHH